MTQERKSPELGFALARRREVYRLSIREAALDAGVSPATFWRSEKGEPPRDVQVLKRLCEFSGLSLSQVMGNFAPRQADYSISTPDFLETQLLSDRNLDTEAARTLASTFRTMYELVLRTRANVSDEST